ncbi:transposase, partial [Nocardia gipuzkoensis]
PAQSNSPVKPKRLDKYRGITGSGPLPFLRKMVIMPKRYPPEVREKALRLALDHLDEYPSAYAAAQAIGPMVDVHPETLRVWIVKAQAEPGQRQPVAGEELSAAERAELDRLRRENRDLKQANEILKLPSAFFASM